MKKRHLIIRALIIFLFVITGLIAINNCIQQRGTEKALYYIENVLDNDWVKHAETIASSQVYSDNEGNTIVFYECTTNYFDAYPHNRCSLNTEAIAAIIDLNKAETIRELTLSGFPAVIYQKDERAYLCWTITPVLSYIIEYDSCVENEDDILKMAKSTLTGPASTESD